MGVTYPGLRPPRQVEDFSNSLNSVCEVLQCKTYFTYEIENSHVKNEYLLI